MMYNRYIPDAAGVYHPTQVGAQPQKAAPAPPPEPVCAPPAPPPPPRMEAQAFRWAPAPGSRLPDCSGPLCTRLTARRRLHGHRGTREGRGSGKLI